MSVHLRPAADDDLAAIGALHFHSRATAYADLLSPDALAYGSPEALGEWWAERWTWERETHRLTVAVIGDDLAGFSYVGPSEEDGVAELYALHAGPSFVGTGVGRALMLDAVPALAARGSRAVLWVLEGNARARRFYERGGWAADGTTRTEAIGGEPVAQLRYGRSLTAASPQLPRVLEGGSA
jgi:GNAT superfamily N-acetyltransferase